jgi:putative peptidoglycan lipid II flippase
MTAKMLRSAASVGVMTGASRILGLVRDTVIAHAFGAGAQVDAYIVAFRIPNLLRRLFAEGAFSQAFIPVLTTQQKHRSAPEIKAFLDAVAGHLIACLVLVSLLGVALAPLLTLVFAPGFAHDPPLFALAVQLVRITFPYILCVSLAALAAGILNTHGWFALPAATPILLNVAIIGSAIYLAPQLSDPITALGWGILIGGVAQVILQMPALLRIGVLPRPRLQRPDAATRQLWRLMLPALFGASVSQISLILNTIMASFLVPGSVSWLYYSDRLMEFPLGIFTLALATVVLPNLSRHHADDDPAQYSATLDWALRWTLVVTVPAALALAVLAVPLLATLFQYGRFTTPDVLMASRSLAAYAPGLIGLSLVKVLAPAFYAKHDTTSPMRIGVLAILANVVINLVLSPYLGHTGLALGTSCAAAFHASILFRTLIAAGVYRPGSAWHRFACQVGLASAGMVLIVYLLSGTVEFWLQANLLQRVLHLAMVVGSGLASYAILLRCLGLRWADMTGPTTAV